MRDQGYLVALVGALVALGLIIELLRRRRLTEKYAVIWLVLGLGIAVCAAWPNLLEAVSRLVGIAVPANLLFLVAGFCLLVVSLQHSSEISRLEDETRSLAEEIALLRHQVGELQRRG